MGKLAGKTVGFVGQHGYKNNSIPIFTKWVEYAGGTVVDVATTLPDFLFVGDGRGGKPPGEVAKLVKKAPSMEVLAGREFFPLLVPEPDQFLKELEREGRAVGDVYWANVDFWNPMDWICGEAKTKIDLSQRDLRKVNFYWANLKQTDLTGSDLRGTHCGRTSFSELNGVNLDGIEGKNACFQDVKNCTFRKANLLNSFWGRTIDHCIFDHSNLQKAVINDKVITDCTLIEADLSEAFAEKSQFRRVNLTGANLSRFLGNNTDFEGINLSKANFEKANLTGANFKGADLRDTNFQGATLIDANLSGANIEGANFKDALLKGANLEGLDLSKMDVTPSAPARTPGPNLLALVAYVKDLKIFETKVEVDIDHKEFVILCLGKFESSSISYASFTSYSNGFTAGGTVTEYLQAPSLEQGMINLVERWHKGTIRLGTIENQCKPVPRGHKLEDFRQLVRAAWAETYGLPDLSPAGIQQTIDQQARAIADLREEMITELKGGKAGIEKWNNRTVREHEKIGALNSFDLKGAHLDGVNLQGMNLEGSSFEGASLKNANLHQANCNRANFTRARISGSNLNNSSFQDANLTAADLTGSQCIAMAFMNANLSQANFTGCNLNYAALQGADLTGAILKDIENQNTHYNQYTKFPKGFVPAAPMHFIEAPPPVIAADTPAPEAGSLDFETFLVQLKKKIEEGRIDKAGAMLKKERFQLFTEVNDDSLTGVVKSQSDKELVYSSRLTSKGSYSCCTQNLKPCGGLKGSLCKHLLVLIIGLAKAKKLDAATVNHWVDLSRSQKAVIDKDAMSTIFLRYKSAEAGEVDWRPTETIPEDFYAM